MKFNNIKMSHSYVACDLGKQRHLKDRQSSTQYWKEHKKEDYLAYSGQSHCGLISTDVETIQASSETGERNYNLVIVPNAEDLGLSVSPVLRSLYVTERINFFPSGVIPADVYMRTMRSARDGVLRILDSGVQSVSAEVAALFDNYIVFPIKILLMSIKKYNLTDGFSV